MGARLPIGFAAALMAAAATAVPGGEGRGDGLMPYPMENCRALAGALARDVPLPEPFTAEKEWFRDRDLGLKGWQCRIAAKGRVRMAAGSKAPPGLGDIATIVTRVLETHGFKEDELLERYKREEDAYRAFALRKDRATCRVNLEIAENDPEPEGTTPAAPAVAVSETPAVWRLTVDCFVG